MFNFKKDRNKKKEEPKDFKTKTYEFVETLVSALIMALIIRALFVQAYKIPTGSMEPTLLGSEQSRNHPSRIGDHLLVEKLTYGMLLPFTDIRLPGIRKIRRGDIVVFKYPYEPKKDYIKRVIGLPGEILQINNKQVYINGKKIEEPWLRFGNKHYNSGMTHSEEDSTRDNFGPVIIPKKGDIITFNNDKIYINDKFIYNKKIISYYSKEIVKQYLSLYNVSTHTKEETKKNQQIIPNKKYIITHDCYFVMGDNRDNSADSRLWGFLSYQYITGKPLIKYFPPTRMGLIK